MLISHRVTVPADPERVWALMLDVPEVSRCVPGLSEVVEIDPRTFSGTMSVRVGPIQLRLEGRISLQEQDEATHTARMQLEAADKRMGGAVNASMRLRLTGQGQGTDIEMETDARVLGKLGDFGQPVIRKKAEQLTQEFASKLSAALA